MNKFLALASLAAFLPGTALAAADDSRAAKLTKMSIQQLMNMEITSVSKSEQPLSQAPSAIFVISQEDIRRSGATTIPDLLRTVPGAQVAQINSHQWAVTIRGFNGSLANKLLVLVDGRSVYTPLHAGVYWDTEDTLLEDIERIEVIRGPGASVWGSNAVNGVINIITKNARDTQGSQVTAGAGTHEKGFGSYRFGDAVGEDGYYRVYGKYFDRDDNFNGNDSWNQGRAGFRADWDKGRDRYMLQGGYYNGEEDIRATDTSPMSPFSQTLFEDEIVYGGHLLGRWTRVEDEQRETNLQMYYTQTHRDQSIFKEDRYTFDVDWDSRFPIADRHEFMWGAGYRMMADDTAGDLSARFVPADKVDHLFSFFAQDEVTLVEDRLRFTIGSKFEHNDYTGFEVQPSARLSWQMTPEQTMWGAVSRAVRIPTRFDHDLDISGWASPGTSLLRLLGDSMKDSEKLWAYEIGHRFQPSEDWSFDTTVFFNDYEDISTATLGTPYVTAATGTPFLVVPLYVDDNLEGHTYGAEVSVQYQMLSNWKLIGAYSLLRLDLESSNDFLAQENAAEGNNPRNQASLRSVVDLTETLEFDSQLRYVDSLYANQTASYIELDLRLGWHVTPDFEISVVGQNLLDDRHTEFANRSSATAPQTERSVYGKMTWTF